MKDRAANVRAPVHIDEQLVADLPKVPDFSTINNLVDFFLAAAADPFSVASPAELHARGVGGAAPAQSKLLLFTRLLYLRAAELLPEAVRAINESRLISFALATRGLLETAAVASYHSERLTIDDGATALPDDYNERLNAAVLSGKFDWMRLTADPAAQGALIDAYDTKPDEQQPVNAAKSIVTMVDKLGKRLGQTMPKARGTVHLHYAMLSDMCHPSAGNNLIFITEAEPRIRAELVPQRVTLLGVATSLLPSLAFSAQALVDVIAELEVQAARLGKMPRVPAAGTAERGGSVTSRHEGLRVRVESR